MVYLHLQCDTIPAVKVNADGARSATEIRLVSLADSTARSLRDCSDRMRCDSIQMQLFMVPGHQIDNWEMQEA